MTIGLLESSLNTTEALGMVEVCAGVVTGMLGRSVTISLNTMDTMAVVSELQDFETHTYLL